MSWQPPENERPLWPWILLGTLALVVVINVILTV